MKAARATLGLTQAELGRLTGYSGEQVGRFERGESSPRSSFTHHVFSLLPAESGPRKADFSFIDLFAGIGGFRLGFEAAGGQCVFTSEWDKYSQLTYKANYGEEHVHGDITKIATSEIPQYDVLLAGFPCQPFSIAGVSKKNSLGVKHGFECETQGTLFFEIERILADTRPKAFVLENVKNLVSHDRGRTFAVIKRTLQDKLGYRISSAVIDAKRFVPQHRERIFIVGLRSDLKTSFDWLGLDKGKPVAGPRLRSILHPEDGTEPIEARYLDERGRVLPKYVLTDNLWAYLRQYAAKHQAQGNGFGFGLVGPEDVARTLSARYYKDGSEILIRRKRGNPRRLTPRECARLMGFDRPGHPPFRIVVSDTQAYRQFGNAVAVPVVREVAKAVARCLASASSKRSPVQAAGAA
ncbi:MAG: DNA (cytosine-5-)-methyltransferase [Gemmatimonadales bacterium]|nr:DNA (cytosine-5-)-methyltransferase [Gemmatimonadales bacterium]